MHVAKDLAQVDLNLLHTFRAVVTSGGVGLAARQLRRSQPAVSARLRQLEAHLGVALFERAGRGLVLSVAGRAIADEVGRIVDSLQGVLDRLRAASEEPTGVLRIGALPTVSAYVLAPLMAGFLASFAGTEIDLKVGLAVEQLAHLRRGQLDLVASVGAAPRADLEVIELGRAVPLAAFPARSALKKRARIGLDDLRAHALVGFGKIGDPFFDAVWDFLEEHDLRGNVRLTAPNIQTMQQLVLHGAGIAILPGYTIQTPGLAALPVEGLALSQPIWLAVRPSSRGVPLVERFLAALEGIHSNR